jgi:hypothetical protein
MFYHQVGVTGIYNVDEGMEYTILGEESEDEEEEEEDDDDDVGMNIS